MANAALPGNCLCGSVRFTAVPKSYEMGVCHCVMCRRWSGGAFMAVECETISVADSTDLAFYTSSEWGERGFCRACGTSLFWRTREGFGDHQVVALQSFDDLSAFSFGEEIFIDQKPDLYAFSGERLRKTGAEVMAEFAPGQAD